jgi:hypothetical protein
MSETAHAEGTQTSPGPALKADTSASSAQSLYLARKVARKAVSLSAAAETMGAGGNVAGEGMAGGGSPADVAAQGFSGSAQEVPHRAEMEKSFGVGFGHVKAYTDAPAKKANEQLGSNAYAMNDSVAFGTANPSKELVAHELTHVMQHTGSGPARKPTGGNDGGIDVEGEGEAEAVEAAVGQGKPASSVWGGAGNAEGEGKAAGVGPARKAKGPALDSKYSTGMTFNKDGFEKQYEYSFWNLPRATFPIVAVPGLFFVIEPQAKFRAAGGVDWSKNELKTNVGLQGGVFVGFEYGNKDVAALYGGLECTLGGGFEYSKSKDSWSLEGSLKLSSNFTIGCKVAGGILDYKFDFGKVDPICKFGGIKWEKGKPFQAGGFEWGPQVLEFFNAVKRTVAKAQELLRAGAEAARRTMEAARATGRAAYNTGRDVVNWVTSW